MSIEACINFCSTGTNAYMYAGVEYASEAASELISHLWRNWPHASQTAASLCDWCYIHAAMVIPRNIE